MGIISKRIAVLMMMTRRERRANDVKKDIDGGPALAREAKEPRCPTFKPVHISLNFADLVLDLGHAVRQGLDVAEARIVFLLHGLPHVANGHWTRERFVGRPVGRSIGRSENRKIGKNGRSENRKSENRNSLSISLSL